MTTAAVCHVHEFAKGFQKLDIGFSSRALAERRSSSCSFKRYCLSASHELIATESSVILPDTTRIHSLTTLFRVTYVLPLGVVEIREYVGKNDRSPFGKWFESLDSIAAAKVTVALVRLEQGNFSRVKSVGSGVYEYRIDFGPGYRVYFGKDGEALVILLGGGTKRRQNTDIQTAVEYWKNYKERKAQER